MSSEKNNLEYVFSLLEKFGREPYIGEAVSQMQHAQQAAGLAEREGFGDQVIIGGQTWRSFKKRPTNIVFEGAFLHDIGHLVGMDESLCQMVVEGVHLGIERHDRVGEEFLAAMGFPESVTKFVRGHVLAKRYLVFKLVLLFPGFRPIIITILTGLGKNTSKVKLSFPLNFLPDRWRESILSKVWRGAVGVQTLPMPKHMKSQERRVSQSSEPSQSAHPDCAGRAHGREGGARV